MNQRNRGYTIIEVMLVVMIISILALIAIPAYQNYAMRAKIAESLMLLSAQKTAISEYYDSQGVFPGSNAEAGLAEPEQISSRYVTSVEVLEDGIIRAALRGTEFGGNTISLVPVVSDPGDKTIDWKCESSLSANFLPGGCSSEGG